MRLWVAAAAAIVLLAGCGGGKSKHAAASSTQRSVAEIAQCLAGQHLQVLRSGPDGTSVLYTPKAGKVTVFRIPKYAASIWVYPSHAVEAPIFQQSAEDLKELGWGNVIAVYAASGQPTHAIEQPIDGCAFGSHISDALPSPLIEVPS